MSNARKIAQVSLTSARACLVKKNYGRAFANFLLFLKLAPRRCEEVRSEFSVAMREWSESLERDGKISDLFKCYDQACEMFPNHDAVLNNIGAQLFRLGYTEEAAAYIRRALIINPDYLAARENLENICSHLVERWHFRMLNDVKRNKAYKDAIRRAVNKGYDSVLDIGTGTGILSLIACDVGASFIYACEKSHAMYEVARDVLQANCADDRVLLFHQSSTDLSVPDNLSERVSLVVTETFDAGLFGEHIISTLTHAWRNLLTNIPAMMGSVIPCAATMYVCGIESESLRKQNRLLYPMLQNLDLSGMDIVCTTGQVAEEPYTTENLARLPGGYKMLTNVTELLRVNFCNPHELEVLQLGKDWIANLIVKQYGRLDAMAVWFDLHLDECVTITTAPDTENCWEQAVYPVLSVKRERDTGQEICYLNKEEHLQVTFHFESDCLRLSGCVVHEDKHLSTCKHASDMDMLNYCCISSDYHDQRTCTSLNENNCSILPLRKRKIRNDFFSSEISPIEKIEESDNVITIDQRKNCESGSEFSQTDVPQQNVIAVATDEYLLEQCGNLTLNNGSKSSTNSCLGINNLSALHIESHAVDQLDEFNLSSNSNSTYAPAQAQSRVLESPLASRSSTNFSINRLLSNDGDMKHNTANYDESDPTPKQLVEYLVDSDEDGENVQTSNYSRNNEKQTENFIINSSLLSVKADPTGLSSFEQLFPESDSVKEIQVTSKSTNYGPDSDAAHMKSPRHYAPLDNLEMINEEQCSSFQTLTENCGINHKNICRKDLPELVKMKDKRTFERQNDKYICLADHSDILYLNDIHLNRSYVKVLELLQKKHGSVNPLFVMFNTTRLCFLALQARSMNFSPVTMVTSEEHHGTLQNVMAANNLKPEEVTLLDISETDGDEEKYDAVIFDLVEPCGALRQQVLEDIALLRITSLSETGVIVPGKVTIHGIFIESQELECMSHVTGSDKTLGYSIADFINVFQLIYDVNSSKNTVTLHYDETTTTQVIKQMDLHFRFWSEEQNEVVRHFYTALMFGHAEGAKVAAAMVDKLEEDKLRNHVNIDLETLQHTKLTEVFQLFHLDLNQPFESDNLQCLQQMNQICVKVLESGTVTALVYWFELHLLDNLKICTLDPRSHWKQAGIIMKEETCVETDQCLFATVTLQNSCLDVTVKNSLLVNGSSSTAGLL